MTPIWVELGLFQYVNQNQNQINVSMNVLYEYYPDWFHIVTFNICVGHYPLKCSSLLIWQQMADVFHDLNECDTVGAFYTSTGLHY